MLVREHKGMIIPKFSSSITNKDKLGVWTNITAQLQAMGVKNSSPAVTRDKLWANLRRNTLKRYDQEKKTGASGSKWTDIDEIVMDIEGRDSANVNGTNIPDLHGASKKDLS